LIVRAVQLKKPRWKSKMAFLVVGILAILIGLIWVGQGSGYFPYPASSFNDQSDAVGLSGRSLGGPRPRRGVGFSADLNSAVTCFVGTMQREGGEQEAS